MNNWIVATRHDGIGGDKRGEHSLKKEKDGSRTSTTEMSSFYQYK